MIEPEHFIENPFAEPEEKENAVTQDARKKRPLPMASTSANTDKYRTAAENANKVNEAEYDLILARMVSQNRKLNLDPRSMRRNAVGMGKLQESFERLQREYHSRNEANAEGLGVRSKEFGLSDDDQDAEHIDWELWGGLIKNFSTVLATSPIELSKAIYAGVPHSLRGMLWQLLSSSKDEELETQYKRYLNQPCSYDSAIRRDLILARMVSQNRKLNLDPRSMRRNAVGMGKLQESFERLQREYHSRNEANAEGLGVRSKEFGLSDDDQDAEHIDWELWGGLIKNFSTVLATSPIELSKAIYAGVPHSLRGMLWQLLSSSKDEELETQYKRYLNQPCSYDSAIRRDLNRTFPTQEFFRDAKGMGQGSLYHVVKAYALYDPECGYCQGMQFIVGPLLLNMPEEEAFCVLVHLMENYDLRGHFIPNMPSLQLRLFQFDRLVEDMLPMLHAHFLRCGIKSTMYASQWFMTLFSYRFPMEIVYRILDAVFSEGIDAVFRFAIALLRKNEDKLLTLDFENCLDFVKLNLTRVYFDISDDGKHKHSQISELVRDAFQVRITQFTLDTYANEFYDQVNAANRKELEMDSLRLLNRNLRLRVQSLEEQLSHLNTEHVQLVKRVVTEKLSHEEIAEELVRYKIMYAEAVLQNDKGRRPTQASTPTIPTP